MKTKNEIQKARERMGIGRLEASRMFGVTRMAYWNWERDPFPATKETLKKIYKIYGLTPNEVFNLK